MNISVFLLLLTALAIRLFAAHLDPFLHDWDEKYHALVARNMMTHPFKPMLKTEILIPYDYKSWCCNHIWLHKQPLFMWQMAISMKIFSISEFAVRYPSVLLGALMIPLVYRITVLLTKNDLVAWGAAALMCFSNYHFELISGYNGMDHNDVSFSFYVLASIWAYMEYTNNRSMKWVILIGIFSGCAILNKWLTGLLVFSGWGINILLSIKGRDSLKEVVHLLIALMLCCIIFLPWQFYIFHAFPKEAAYEFAFNAKHIFEAVEGHAGHNETYFNLFPKYFGNTIWVLVLLGFFAVYKLAPSKKPKYALLVYILIVYVFFSFIVQTKATSYFFPVVPIGYIFMAAVLGLLIKVPHAGRIAFTSAILISCYVLFDFSSIQLKHHSDNIYRKNKTYNTIIYKNLHKHLPKNVSIVMNLGPMEDADCMFYNPGINAFHYIYWPEELELLKEKDIKFGVFKEHSGFKVPTELLNNPNVYIIDQYLEPTIEYYR